MNKADVVDKVAAQTGLSKKDAGEAVESVLNTIQSTLRSGGEISFTGFGKFHVAERGARQGINPATRQPIQIPATRVPRFSAGAGLKQAVKS